MCPTDLRVDPADRSLAEYVQTDSRAARVFERFELDFCCNGRRTVREAALAQRVPLDEVVQALTDLGEPAAGETAQAEWNDLGALARHIVERHHAYVRSAVPAIGAWLDRLVDRHGDRHPELDAMRRVFGDVAAELMSHMVKEEQVLFPYIEDLASAVPSRRMSGGRGTVLDPIRVMEAEHALVGGLTAELRRLSGGFVPPTDGCTTYRLCFAELAQFERDLHQHIHLENNILFPGAIELERGLAQTPLSRTT